MTKRLTIRSQSEIDAYREELRISAEETRLRIAEIAGDAGPLELLYRMKFEEIGCDPLRSERPLNLIEQLNQTFTYLASLKAAEYLLSQHPGLESLTLNLGTRPGWDIESDEDGGIVAEVFATVNPRNNRKLEKDIEKVSVAEARHRYVFFMCPGFESGPYQERGRRHGGVVIWSLGCEARDAP